MTKEEIKSKIEVLKAAAANFSQPEKTFKLSEINQLKIELHGMTLDEIADKMESISLPEIHAMNEQIEAANDATKAESQRVEAFNGAIDFLKGVLEVAI